MHSILTFEINFFLFMIFNRKSASNREIHEIHNIGINILLREAYVYAPGGYIWLHLSTFLITWITEKVNALPDFVRTFYFIYYWNEFMKYHSAHKRGLK
jgi:hypothetical protein